MSAIFNSAACRAGKGTSIRLLATLLVPSPGGSGGTPQQPSCAEEHNRPRRVLVVDDNPDAAELLAFSLALDGHDVRTAVSGQEALQIAQRFHPEVAFLDIGLPNMDGHEVARRLRTIPGLESMLLIAVTGYCQQQYRQRSHDAGCDYHLVKPVDLDALQALVREHSS